MDKNEISISVVMPVYNGERYIRRTLENVFSQTSLPTELVIVDDGSKDATVKIIKAYIREHQEYADIIKLYSQENKGAGAARNKALYCSTSEWIAFFDSDDIWDNRKLEIIRNEIKRNKDAVIITHDEYEANEHSPEQKRYVARHKSYIPKEDLFLQLYKGNFFSTTCMVIQKEIIERAGGFDETLLSAQDYDLWIRCGKYAKKIVYLDKPLSVYVTRDDNITKNTFRRYQCEMRISRKYAVDVIEKLGKKRGRKIIRKRVFDIHKVEAYLSLKNKQFQSFFKIGIRLPVELVREM